MREKMPRKMKKRFKNLMKFFDERKKEYEQEKTAETFVGMLILQKLKEMNINPDDVQLEQKEDGKYYAKIHESIKSMDLEINLEEVLCK